MRRWNWTVDAERSQERADRAILSAIESGLGEWESEGEPVAVSRSQIQRLMEEGQVLANGAPCLARTKLPDGTRVEIRFPAPKPTTVAPEDLPLEILFQDEHLLVLNKPPGLTVHPSPTQMEGTLVNALLHHIKDLSGIGGELRPGIVHRIDKDTSGALVVTKTDEAHRKLTEVFARHDIERAYWALCYGSPRELAKPGSTMRIETRIGRNPVDRKKMAVLKVGGRDAISHVSRIEDYAAKAGHPFASWLEVRLETGRTHQVRVHLTSIGHSLLGDPVYGTPSEKAGKWLLLPEPVRDAVRSLPGQALHARLLGFAHPITGEKLRFEAEPPEAFRRVLQSLQANTPQARHGSG